MQVGLVPVFHCEHRRSAFQGYPPFGPGPVRWPGFYRQVILDIRRRRFVRWSVVGWRVENAESATPFKARFSDAVAKHTVPPDQLTLHAARGGPVKATATALIPADPGVGRSHSRPHTPNDNPFSQAHFKTLNYMPELPKRFETIEDARIFCRRFFAWYDEDHHNAGIGLMTPNKITSGKPPLSMPPARQHVMLRSPAQPSKSAESARNHRIPTAFWINPPKQTEPVQARTQNQNVSKSLTRSIPMAGVKPGYAEMSWLFFSGGMIFWVVVLTLVMNRQNSTIRCPVARCQR